MHYFVELDDRRRCYMYIQVSIQLVSGWFFHVCHCVTSVGGMIGSTFSHVD
jgi:hypothetical protein